MPSTRHRLMVAPWQHGEIGGHMFRAIEKAQ